MPPGLLVSGAHAQGPNMPSTLSFNGLRKSYGGAPALSDVSLTLLPGRVHALVGENGAGKSTLIKLIAGVVPADTMTVTKDGAPITLNSAGDALAAGFRFIHQELNIVPQLSVAENILLGQPGATRYGLFVDWKALSQKANSALAELGIDDIDVRVHAGGLGVGDQMLVKIASALVRDEGAEAPGLYVFDEPTAALSDTESEKLFDVIERLKKDGAAILYVSHRLGEIMQICDDVTVLRNGAHVITTPIADTSRDEIVHQMTGRELMDGYPPRIQSIGANPVCAAKNISSAKLDQINFTLRDGEILGVAGLSDCGQTEILRLFLGLERALAGSLTFNTSAAPRNPVQAWQRGVAYVPRERRSEGLMMTLGVRQNTLLPHYRGLFANRRAEIEKTRGLETDVKLKAVGPDQVVHELSGGNQQKVVFAKAIAKNPRLLLLDEPTRGVDVGAKFEIYSLIRHLSEGGCSVIMSSSDLPELIGMCDRILILHAGRQYDIIEPQGMQPGDLLATFYDHHKTSELP